LTEEQINRLAGICGIRQFEMGATIFKEGETATEMFVVLSGEANIYLEDASQPVGAVTTGECLGELSALSGASHSATATAKQSLEVATINHTDFAQLVRQRPDIGVQIYKNLAVGLGEKLRRSDTFIAYIAGQDPIPLADK
jgi:CRP-like cAMP-binding protein